MIRWNHKVKSTDMNWRFGVGGKAFFCCFFFPFLICVVIKNKTLMLKIFFKGTKIVKTMFYPNILSILEELRKLNYAILIQQCEFIAQCELLSDALFAALTFGSRQEYLFTTACLGFAFIIARFGPAFIIARLGLTSLMASLTIACLLASDGFEFCATISAQLC